MKVKTNFPPLCDCRGISLVTWNIFCLILKVSSLCVTSCFGLPAFVLFLMDCLILISFTCASLTCLACGSVHTLNLPDTVAVGCLKLSQVPFFWKVNHNKFATNKEVIVCHFYTQKWTFIWDCRRSPNCWRSQMTAALKVCLTQLQTCQRFGLNSRQNR